MAEKKGQILIVDDSAFMRLGLRRYLEIQGYEVFEAANVAEATAILDEHHPQVSIVDISIPQSEQDTSTQEESHGLRLTQVIKEKDPDAGVILLSAYQSYYPEFQNLVRKYHGLAYLFKGDNRRNELLFVIEQVQKGGIWVAPEILNYYNQSVQASSANFEKLKIMEVVGLFHHLTEREKEIVEMVASSADNAAIAEKLSIPVNAVTAHLLNIYIKVGLGANLKEPEKRVLLAKAYLLYRS